MKSSFLSLPLQGVSKGFFSFSTFLAVYFCVLTLWCMVETEIIKNWICCKSLQRFFALAGSFVGKTGKNFSELLYVFADLVRLPAPLSHELFH